MSTGVIFILGKGVSPILASGVKSTWPQGSSAPGFSIRDAPRRWMLGAALVLYGYKSAVQVKDVGVGTRNIHFHFNSFAFAEFD